MDEDHFEEFSTLISGIHGNIQKLKTRYTAQFGLKPVHVLWLYLLRTYPEGMSASELAAACGFDRSLVSQNLNQLLDGGVVTTLASGVRRRYGWKLVLTEKGMELAEIISAVAVDIQNPVSRDIPASDLAAFYRTLRTLSGKFEELVKTNNIQEVIDNERKTDR